MVQQTAQASVLRSWKNFAKDRLKFNIFEQCAFYHQKEGFFVKKDKILPLTPSKILR